MATRVSYKSESPLSLQVATADIVPQVFVQYIYPALLTMVGVSGNAFIIRSEFRSLRTDLKELGASTEAFAAVREELAASVDELRAAIGATTRRLEDNTPACVGNASAVENEHWGLVRLSGAMHLLSKQEAERSTTPSVAEYSMPACVEESNAVDNMHGGLVRLSKAMHLLSKQKAEHSTTPSVAGYKES